MCFFPLREIITTNNNIRTRCIYPCTHTHTKGACVRETGGWWPVSSAHLVFFLFPLVLHWGRRERVVGKGKGRRKKKKPGKKKKGKPWGVAFWHLVLIILRFLPLFLLLLLISPSARFLMSSTSYRGQIWLLLVLNNLVTIFFKKKKHPTPISKRPAAREEEKKATIEFLVLKSILFLPTTAEYGVAVVV